MLTIYNTECAAIFSMAHVSGFQSRLRSLVWLDHVFAQRAARAYWNVNYLGVIRAIAMARSVVGLRS